MPYSELIHLLKQLYGLVPARCLAKCADGCIVPWWRDPLHPGTNCANMKKFIQFLGRPIEIIDPNTTSKRMAANHLDT